MGKLEKIYLIFNYLFLYFWGGVQAQSSYDMIEKRLWNTHKDSTNKVLNELYNAVSQYDKEKAKTIWLALIQKAKIRNEPSLVIQISMQADRYFFAQKMLQEELMVANDLTKFMKSKKLGLQESEVYLTFASRYMSIYMSDTALEYYLRALAIFEKYKDMPNLFKTYYGIGNAFYKSDPKKSRKYLLKSLQYKKYVDDLVEYISCLNTIGLTYRKEKDVANALKYFEEALATAIEYKNKEWQGIIYGNIGALYYNNKDYKTALKYFLKELTLIKDKTNIIITYFTIAECYALSNQISEAKKYLDSGLVDNNINDIYLLRLRTQSLKTYFSQINDYKNAYKYLEQYRFYDDSITKMQHTIQIEEIIAKNGWEQQYAQIMDLEEKAKLKDESIFRLRWIIYIIFVSMFVLAALLYIINKYYQESKKLNITLHTQQEEIAAQNEELKQQQEQLNSLNNQLEALVVQRTQKLIQSNQKLNDYAFFNAHKLRAPITTILGLYELLKLDTSLLEKEIIFEKIKASIILLDEMVKKSQILLDEIED